MNREKRTAWLRRIGYAAAFAMSFVVMLFVFLPTDSIKRTMELRLSKALRRPVTVASLETRFPIGFALEQVGFGPSFMSSDAMRRAGSSGGVQGDAPSLVIEQADLYPHLLGFLFGGMGFDFTVHAWGGEMDGSYHRGEDLDIDVSGDEILLKRFTLLKDFVPLPLSGEMALDVELSVPEGAMKKTAGRIRIVMDDVAIGDGKTQMKGVTIDPIRLGKVEGRITVENGIATIDSFGCQGKDLDFSWQGKITLSDDLLMSRLDTYVMFRFSDAFRNSSERIRTMLSALDRFSTSMRRAKRTDGFYGFRLTGNFKASPRFLPSKRFQGERQPAAMDEDREPRRRRGLPVSRFQRIEEEEEAEEEAIEKPPEKPEEKLEEEEEKPEEPEDEGKSDEQTDTDSEKPAAPDASAQGPEVPR